MSRLTNCTTCGCVCGKTYCSPACELVVRQIAEAHAGDNSRLRAGCVTDMPLPDLPVEYHDRPRPTVVIGGVVLPWGERIVLMKRRASL